MSLARKFIKVMESGKVKFEPEKYNFWSQYISKILRIVLNKSEVDWNASKLVFSDYGIVNTGNKFSDGWNSNIPFIPPKFDERLDRALSWSEYVDKFGIEDLIKVLKKIVKHG